MNTIMIIILIVSSVLALGILGIFISRKFTLDSIYLAKTLVVFIKTKLNESSIGVGNVNYNIILDIIIQSLCYIQSISTSTSTTAYKVSTAYSFTKNLIQQAGITLSSRELEIIRLILKSGFEIMDSIEFTAGKVTSNNYLRLYKAIIKHADIHTSIAVGLRKSIK